MDDHGDGLALASVQVAHEGHEVVAGADIQIGGGLVQHDEVGVLGERSGQMHSLALAAGKLAQVVIAEGLDAGPLHGVFHDPAVVGAEAAAPAHVRLPPAGHQGLHSHGRHARTLSQHRHQPRPLAGSKCARVAAGHVNASRRRAQKARGQLHQRRFPAAVGADNARHRARGDDRGKPLHEGNARLVGERDVLVADGALRRARLDGGRGRARRPLALNGTLSQGRLLCSSG